MNVALELARDAARARDAGHARLALEDAALFWSAQASRELLPRDRLWVRLGCGACGRSWDRAFRFVDSPFFGAGTAPLYRSWDEAWALLDAALVARPAGVDPPTWSDAIRCECGAPRHHTRADGVALLHARLGTGSGVVLFVEAAAGGAGPMRVTYRLPEGGGRLTPTDGEATLGAPEQAASGLFAEWTALARGGVPDAGTAAGALVEPGVWIFFAPRREVLDAAVATQLGERARHLVALRPELARSVSWPEDLRALGASLEAGAAAALVVEHEALLASMRSLARVRAGVDVVLVSGDAAELRWEQARWPVALTPIALAMAHHGRSLAEACAKALEEAMAAVEHALATLRRMVELHPGSSFDVEGTRALARRADGREGRALELAQLPSAGPWDEGELERTARFLFDELPEWADATRVCACGAAAFVQRRLVPWPWQGEPDSAPALLRAWGPADGAARAAEVVVIACDRHVRFLSSSSVHALGLAGAELERRLEADLDHAVHRLSFAWIGDGRGARALLCRGPFAASVLLDDRWLAALHAGLGSPFGEEPVEALALGADAFALVPSAFAALARAELMALTAAASLVAPWAPDFAVRRVIDLSAAPAGRFVLAEASGADPRAPSLSVPRNTVLQDRLPI